MAQLYEAKMKPFTWYLVREKKFLCFKYRSCEELNGSKFNFTDVIGVLRTDSNGNKACFSKRDGNSNWFYYQ